MPSIYKRRGKNAPKQGKTWIAKLFASEVGRVQYRSFYTKDEARRWALQEIAASQNSHLSGPAPVPNPQPECHTIGATLTAYRQSRPNVIEHVTWVSNERPVVDYWQAHEFADRRLDQLYRDEIKGWIKSERRAGRTAYAIRRRLNVLKRAIDLALDRWRLQLGNPAARHRVKKTPPRRRRPTPAERDCLIDEAARYGALLYYICRWAEECGMRAGEIARMKHADLDHSQGMPILKVPRTKTVPRQFFVWPSLHSLYREIVAALDLPAENPYVFGGLRRDSITQGFTRIRDRAGVDSAVTFHSLRYEANSWMADFGIDKDLRMEVMGHVDEHVNRDYTQHAARAASLIEHQAKARQQEIINRRPDNLTE